MVILLFISHWNPTSYLKVLNRLTEAPRDNFKFEGNLNYITLCLTDNLTITSFFTLPPKL